MPRERIISGQVDSGFNRDGDGSNKEEDKKGNGEDDDGDDRGGNNDDGDGDGDDDGDDDDDDLIMYELARPANRWKTLAEVVAMVREGGESVFLEQSPLYLGQQASTRKGFVIEPMWAQLTGTSVGKSGSGGSGGSGGGSGSGGSGSGSGGSGGGGGGGSGGGVTEGSSEQNETKSAASSAASRWSMGLLPSWLALTSVNFWLGRVGGGKIKVLCVNCSQAVLYTLLYCE
jgi:hypothetical protein